MSALSIAKQHEWWFHTCLVSIWQKSTEQKESVSYIVWKYCILLFLIQHPYFALFLHTHTGVYFCRLSVYGCPWITVSETCDRTCSIGGIGLQVLESGSYFSPLARTVLCSSVPPITNRNPPDQQRQPYYDTPANVFYWIQSVLLQTCLWITGAVDCTDRQRPTRGRGGRRSLAPTLSRPACWRHTEDTCSVSQLSASWFCTEWKHQIRQKVRLFPSLWSDRMWVGLPGTFTEDQVHTGDTFKAACL